MCKRKGKIHNGHYSSHSTNNLYKNYTSTPSVIRFWGFRQSLGPPSYAAKSKLSWSNAQPLQPCTRHSSFTLVSTRRGVGCCSPTLPCFNFPVIMFFAKMSKVYVPTIRVVIKRRGPGISPGYYERGPRLLS